MGQAIPASRVEALTGSLYRAYDTGGVLLAVVACNSAEQVWRPKKVLIAP
jgi:hypothetical protein